MNNTPKHYAYPVGDFLSGFSDDPKNPCSYELECQRMVIRGVQYFDEHSDLHETITNSGKTDVFDPILQDLIAHMIEGQEGQSGMMVSHSVQHAYHAHKMGWDEYIKVMVKAREEDAV